MKGRTQMAVMLMATCVFFPAAVQAQAQESARSSGTTIADIVVTAQRRAEPLQKVPIAVSALSGEALESRGLASTMALQAAVPGLTFSRVGWSGTPFIRGVGANAGDPSSEPSVATYVDGVYIASPSANIFDFNAVESVEVLKGPQGTLFGRNATGGVIQIRTKDPSFTPEATIDVGYANYETVTGSVYASMPLNEKVAINFAGRIRDQGDGWGTNLVTGDDTYKRDEWAARMKLLFKPTESTSIILAGDYLRVKSTGNDYKLPDDALGFDGIPRRIGRFDTVNNFRNTGNTRARGVSLTVEHDAGSVILKSISAYRKATGLANTDGDMVPSNFLNYGIHQFQRNYSQELQIFSNTESHIQWVIGGYYFNNRAGYDPMILTGDYIAGAPVTLIGLIDTKSFSAYAQATVPLLDTTKLTGGFRYTMERQSLMNGRQKSDKPTWRIALDHQFSSRIMGYASYNRGIKSGGYSPLTPPPAGAYRPEQIDAFEVGLKTKLFHDTVRLNTSAFWYKYKDIQVQVVDGANVFTQNAAKATIKGFDADLEVRVTPELSFNLNGAYLDGRYDEFRDAAAFSQGAGPVSIIDVSGYRTIHTPKLSGSATVDYRIPTGIGEFGVNVSAIYTGKFYWQPSNRASQSRYALLNSSLNWVSPDETFKVSLWGKNLTNRQFLVLNLESGSGDYTMQGEPRTYGVTAGVKF